MYVGQAQYWRAYSCHRMQLMNSIFRYSVNGLHVLTWIHTNLLAEEPTSQTLG